MAALPAVWNVRTSSASSQLNGIAYGNGMFVAVGSGATILTSPEGINWTPRSAGTTAPTLSSAAYGNGCYVVGGGEGALTRSSVNGIDWTNGLSTTGIEHINGIAYCYGGFVAVGSGPQLNTGYILTSFNGLDWVSQAVPTTNALFAISPAYSGRVGWADTFYVAVGDNGTILTSNNGVDWTLRDSGTSVPLRSVVWSGRFLVGGDHGTILSSSDGISWAAAAPTAFDVCGLATSGVGVAVVAVGNYLSAGRLQASPDGLSWPGSAAEFSQPLNGVAYGGGSFVAVGNGGLILQSIVSPLAFTNEWIKSTSGNWEEPYWSLGTLPSIDQGTVAFRNPGWKALAIGENTTANYPASLSLNSLVIDAPTNSFNQLLLNWAGLGVPLVVNSNFTIGTNGSLASHYSALRAANTWIDGSASFSDGATEDFDQLALSSGATMNLTSGTMNSSNVTFYGGTFTQSGGTHTMQNSQIPQLIGWFTGLSATYYLQAGALMSQNQVMGSGGGYGPEGRGYVQQTGGVHTNVSLVLGGWAHLGSSIQLGNYSLVDGLLVSRSVGIFGGGFVQSGGTNIIQELNVSDGGGSFTLGGGELVTSNTTAYADPNVLGRGFYQTGGVHTVQNRLLIRGGWPYMNYGWPMYELAGGQLATADIEVQGALRFSSQGSVSNTGILTLSGGDIVAKETDQAQYLGQLQCAGGNLYIHDRFGTFTKPTVWRFDDSHALPWTGQLSINGWGNVRGDHIFIGKNAQGLTTAQLAQVSFRWNNTNYPAMLLASGELVPAYLPSPVYTTSGNALVLFWQGTAIELVSATNVTGPYLPVLGATSPFTNTFTDPQRFFRLRVQLQ